MTQDILTQWTLWRAKAQEDPEVIREMEELMLLPREEREKEIGERFYKELEFGTGGLRGIMGAGPNRLNLYTVSRASRGYARYLKSSARRPGAAGAQKTGTEELRRSGSHPEAPLQAPSLVIAYDTRIRSREFARRAAEVFAEEGIRVYLFDEPVPTPLLSYAVPRLGCCGGVVITASHNPAEYNGYKVYEKDGCQITGKTAAAIYAQIVKLGYFDGCEAAEGGSREKAAEGRDAASGPQASCQPIIPVPQSLIQDYLEEAAAQAFGGTVDKELRIVYTPLNGTGLKPVCSALERLGFSDIHVVEEQREPDGHFPTCPAPNPEKREALRLALRDGKRLGADLILATDPDCDRLGLAVRQGQEYRLLSGNETGVLLLDYICQRRRELGRMPEGALAFKTIVTTDLAQKIAARYGVRMGEVLTGFKYIGEQIGCLEAEGQTGRFIFGLEESYGYLSGTYVRDKDGVNAAILACEMAGFYKARGQSLPEVLEKLWEQYGYYRNTQHTIPLLGREGAAQMGCCMERCRAEVKKFPDLNGMRMLRADDYKASRSWYADGREEAIGLPASNVVKLLWEDGSSLAVRPSGTEPKLKIYIQAVGESLDQARGREESLKKLTEELIGVGGRF